MVCLPVQLKLLFYGGWFKTASRSCHGFVTVLLVGHASACPEKIWASRARRDKLKHVLPWLGLPAPAR
jgi:hypothetical protein